MEELEKTLNEQLIRERKLRGWSQENVAEKIGANSKNVGRWERRESTPSHYYQQRLCELFGMDAAQLGFLENNVQSEKQQATDAPFPQENEPIEAEPELYTEQPLPDTSVLTEEQSLSHHITQDVGNSESISSPLLVQLQVLLTQLIDRKDSSQREDLKNAYLQLLTISQARLTFTAVVEVLRRINGKIAYERLPVVKEKLNIAELAFDEDNVWRILALLDTNKVWFHYSRGTQLFRQYIERTKALVEDALRPRSPLIVIVTRLDVMLNPSIDDDPKTRKIAREMENEMGAMVKAMNKRVRI